MEEGHFSLLIHRGTYERKQAHLHPNVSSFPDCSGAEAARPSRDALPGWMRSHQGRSSAEKATSPPAERTPHLPTRCT